MDCSELVWKLYERTSSAAMFDFRCSIGSASADPYREYRRTGYHGWRCMPPNALESACSRAELRGGVVRRRMSRSEYPLWVQASIWGVPGRGGLWAFVVFSLACAALLLVEGLRSGRFLDIAVLMALAAMPYWLAIRWIDRHGSWE